MIRGKVHKYGNNIDTDAIIPARYANLRDPIELGRHCMENIDSSFAQKVRKGDILLAGSNFGCGSSREIAPLSIKGAGISCVIAKSFARIFFRNAINVGLPVLECAEAVDNTESGDELEIDLSSGEIRNLSKGMVFKATPYPDFIKMLISAGGLIEYAKQILQGGER